MSVQTEIENLNQDIRDLVVLNNRSLMRLTKLHGSKHRVRRAKMRLQIKARTQKIKTIRVSLQLLGVKQ